MWVGAGATSDLQNTGLVSRSWVGTGAVFGHDVSLSASRTKQTGLAILPVMPVFPLVQHTFWSQAALLPVLGAFRAKGERRDCSGAQGMILLVDWADFCQLDSYVHYGWWWVEMNVGIWLSWLVAQIITSFRGLFGRKRSRRSCHLQTCWRYFGIRFRYNHCSSCPCVMFSCPRISFWRSVI